MNDYCRLNIDNKKEAEALMPIDLDAWPDYDEEPTPPNKCPSCGGTLLTMASIVSLTSGDYWIAEEHCVDRKTSACP
jgi:hypothetical protein